MQYNNVRIFKIQPNDSQSQQNTNADIQKSREQKGYQNLSLNSHDSSGRQHGKVNNQTEYPHTELSYDKYIDVLSSDVITDLLGGRSCIILGLGPHGCGKSASMLGQRGLLERFLGNLLNQTKGNYQVALSLFELQGKVVLDHLAPENAFQSHFASPSILSCKIASKRDFLLLMHHMQAISQNFDNFMAIPNKANGFARVVCYNYQTRAIVTALFVDVMGDPANYGELIAQLPNCLLPSDRSFVNMEFQTPLIQFITPIMKISKVYLLDFNQGNSNDDIANENFYVQLSQYKSKQIPMRLEIKDWKTIGIDDVQCEQIDLSSLLSSQQSVHTDNMQKTLSPEVALAKSESVIDDLYQSESMQRSQPQIIQHTAQNDEQLNNNEEIEDLYETDDSKINTVQQINVKSIQQHQQGDTDLYHHAQQTKDVYQARNKPELKTVSFNQANMKMSQLSEANLTKSDLNYGRSSNRNKNQFIQDPHRPSSPKKQTLHNQTKEHHINFFAPPQAESSEESVPNQLTVSKVPAHSLLPTKLTQVTNLQEATRRLKETEFVRSDLESKIRLIEAQGAELKIKTELNRINNELRIKLLENLDNGGLQNHEKTLDRLSQQICDQIQANIDLLFNKCKKMTKVPGIQSLQAKFKQEQLHAINQQKNIHELMRLQRQYIKNEVEIEDLKREVNSKLIEQQKNQEILDQQENEINTLNRYIREQEKITLEKEKIIQGHIRQCEEVKAQLAEIKKLANDLGQMPNNISTYEAKIRTLFDHLNTLAKQRMLSHQEINMRNICQKLLELCEKKLSLTNQNDVLKDFKQEIFSKESEAEEILQRLLSSYQTGDQ